MQFFDLLMMQRHAVEEDAGYELAWHNPPESQSAKMLGGATYEALVSDRVGRGVDGALRLPLATGGSTGA